jgi:alkanesulfonate monooxygenase SsuD/methylene tetrahydromethanopterin reductase-like flavin-dependent oxidoreductase (luciferase family)
MHHPIRIAEDIAVLDNLSKGRAIAGFGLGGRLREYAGYGISFKERRRRYEEALPLIHRLLTEENVYHKGRFYKIDRVTVTPPPIQKPRPPIWVAASVEPAIRRAARLGEAWMSRPAESLKELKILTAIYRDELDKCGKEWTKLENVVRRDGWVSENDKKAWKEVLPALHFHYTRDYSFFPSDATLDYMREYGKDRFVIGSPETIIQEINRYEEELGTTLMIIALDNPGLHPKKVLKAVKMLGEKVLPNI